MIKKSASGIAALLLVTAANVSCAQTEDATREETGQPVFSGGEVAHRFEGHESEVTSARFSPGDDRLITASRDDTARIWSLETGELILGLTDHAETVTSAMFSPDGNQILTASQDGTARIWDAQTGELRQTLEGHTGGVSDAAFNPEGTRIVTGGRDGEARLWNVESGETLFRLSAHAAELHSAAFDPSGEFILTASADGSARIWSSDEGVQLAVLDNHPGEVSHAQFGPGGNRVVTTYEDKDVADGMVVSSEGAARIWDWKDERLLMEMSAEGDSNRVMKAVFSPDGSLVATAGRFGTAQIRNGETGEPIFTLGRHFDTVTAVRFSPGGDRLATASGNGSVWVWELSR